MPEPTIPPSGMTSPAATRPQPPTEKKPPDIKPAFKPAVKADTKPPSPPSTLPGGGDTRPTGAEILGKENKLQVDNARRQPGEKNSTSPAKLPPPPNVPPGTPKTNETVGQPTPEFRESAIQAFREGVPKQARDYMRENGVRFTTFDTFKNRELVGGTYDPRDRIIRVPENVIFREKPNDPLQKRSLKDFGTLKGTIGHESAHAIADVSGMDTNGKLLPGLRTAFDNDIAAARARTNLTANERSYLNYYQFSEYDARPNAIPREKPAEALADIINGAALSGENTRDYPTVRKLLPTMDRLTLQELDRRTGLKPKAAPAKK